MRAVPRAGYGNGRHRPPGSAPAAHPRPSRTHPLRPPHTWETGRFGFSRAYATPLWAGKLRPMTCRDGFVRFATDLRLTAPSALATGGFPGLGRAAAPASRRTAP